MAAPQTNAQLQALNEQILAVTAQRNTQQNNVNYALTKLNEARKKAQDCQNARDQRSTGIGKNQACHIDTLSSLNNAWAQADNFYQTEVSKLNALNSQIASLNAQVDAYNKQQQEALLNDPQFNLQQQQINANLNAQNTAAKAQADAAAATKKAIITGVILVVIVAIVIVSIAYLRKRKKQSE